jgi:hypothetical protein
MYKLEDSAPSIFYVNIYIYIDIYTYIYIYINVCLVNHEFRIVVEAAVHFAWRNVFGVRNQK